MKDRKDDEINQIRQDHGNNWNDDHPDVRAKCPKR
jgi:hypothetical protein